MLRCTDEDEGLAGIVLLRQKVEFIWKYGETGDLHEVHFLVEATATTP
jgi:hypothetical protein